MTVICTALGAGIGFVAGGLIGLREGEGIAPAVYAPFGGMVGAIIGAVVGAVAPHVGISIH